MFHQSSSYQTKKLETFYRKSMENENNLLRESIQVKRPNSQSKIKSVLSSLNEQNLKQFRNFPTVKKQVTTPQSRINDNMPIFQDYQTQEIQLRNKERRQVYFQSQLAKNRDQKINEQSSGSLHLKQKIQSEYTKQKSIKEKSEEKAQINNLSGQDFQFRKSQKQLKRSFQEETGYTYVTQGKTPYYNNVNTRPQSQNNQQQLKKYSHSMQSQSISKEDSKTYINANKPQTVEESPDIKMRIKTENENSDDKLSLKKKQQFRTDKDFPARVMDPIITQSLPNAAQNIISRLNSFNLNLLPQLGKTYFHLDQTKKSSVKNGVLRAYAANTHQGLVRNYNEDRVSIIVNVNSGNRIKNSSYFAVYDGHGGSMCSDFLRDNLHLYVIQDPTFPQNPREAIVKGFSTAEVQFISRALEQTKNQHQTERSGSCAVTALLIDDYCYIANVGDSRAVLSVDGGIKTIGLTNDHKPQNDNEKTRILMAGGKIYQSQIPSDKKGRPAQLGPHRVFPGRLSVTRSFGDIEAKLEQFGGRSGVIIAQPEITQFKIQDNHDFVILACDGIFDKLSNEEVVQLVWESASQIDYQKQNVHDFAAIAIENIMKFSLYKKTLDNITVLLIGFKGLKRHFKSMKQKNNVLIPQKMIKSPKNKLENNIDIKQRFNLLKA